jgi:hypothetical protein
MNRGLVEEPGRFVNGGLANGSFPLTPAISMNRWNSNVSAAGLRHSRGPSSRQTNCFLRMAWHRTATAVVLIRNLRD